jgi:lipoprotein-anchoring transpeptidase ErfK/SrfK
MTPSLARGALACACAVGALGSGAHAASARDVRAVRPPASDAALGNERLSDERTITRYANAVARAPVRERPSVHAPRVARLHYQTEDGPLETYLALESHVGAQRTWVRVRIPRRAAERTGWVQRSDLGPLLTVTTMLRVDRRALRATLYDRGRRIWSSRIGIGTPDTPTPAGHFWIRTRLKALGGGTIYGPWAFGTSAYSALSEWPGGGVVGIHGTDQPELIPGRPSHGCIRVPNERIRRLARLMPVGTPVHIV